MFYRIQVLGSFDKVISETNYDDFRNTGQSVVITRVYADRFTDWNKNGERERLLSRVELENGFKVLRGGNVAVRIIDQFDSIKEGYEKGYISKETYIHRYLSNKITIKRIEKQ